MSNVCGKFLVTGSTNALLSTIRIFISNSYMDLQEEGQLNYIKAPRTVSEIGDIQQVLCLSFLFPYCRIKLIYTRQQPFEKYSANHLPCIYEAKTQIEGLRLLILNCQFIFTDHFFCYFLLIYWYSQGGLNINPSLCLEIAQSISFSTMPLLC